MSCALLHVKLHRVGQTLVIGWVLTTLIVYNVDGLSYPSGLDKTARLCGLATKWRMFSPPDRFHWEYRVRGVLPSGELIDLPLPSQQSGNFWQKNLFDFRERKWELNIYRDEHRFRRYALSQYLCWQEYRSGRDFKELRIDLEITPFLPPSEALEKSERYGTTYLLERDSFPCSGYRP